MDASTLSTMIRNNIVSSYPITVKDSDGKDIQVQISGNDPGTKIFCDAIAQAIVQHLTAALDVFVPPSSIVTAGTAAAQSGPPAPVKCLVS